MASKTEGLVILSREVEDLKEELVQVKNHSSIQYPYKRWLYVAVKFIYTLYFIWKNMNIRHIEFRLRP